MYTIYIRLELNFSQFSSIQLMQVWQAKRSCAKITYNEFEKYNFAKLNENICAQWANIIKKKRT